MVILQNTAVRWEPLCPPLPLVNCVNHRCDGVFRRGGMVCNHCAFTNLMSEYRDYIWMRNTVMTSCWKAAAAWRTTGELPLAKVCSEPISHVVTYLPTWTHCHLTPVIEPKVLDCLVQLQCLIVWHCCHLSCLNRCPAAEADAPDTQASISREGLPEVGWLCFFTALSLYS